MSTDSNPRYFIHSAGGPVLSAPAQAGIFPDAESALAALEQEQSESVLLCDARLARPSLPVPPPDADQYDLLHAGLRLAADEVFHCLWLTSTNWLFLNPPSDRRCVSWKATPALCCLHPETVRRLGGFDRAFRSADARLMDLAYRLLAAGGRVCYDPFQLELPISAEVHPTIPLSDELLFIRRHIGRPAALYAAVWMSLTTGQPIQALGALSMSARQARSTPTPRPPEIGSFQPRLPGRLKRQHVGAVSAIIPTLSRYEYLPEAIGSLLRQSPPPAEIIVVDQTPARERQPEVYANFSEAPVRVIYLEQAGQSIARNVGIQAASSDWVLLFDDDSVAWPGLISAHIDAIERSAVSVSTGLSLAPWKTAEHIPASNQYFKLTNIFDTGNSLIQKATLEDVGLFDLAFDHGSGADHDLGVRLYLRGHEIMLNPRAIRTHFKAKTGGLRTYGAWWRNHATFWAPYPQPTQVYTIQRYYRRRYWFPLYLRYYISARSQRSWLELAWLWLSAPWKLARALKAARRLAAHST